MFSAFYYPFRSPELISAKVPMKLRTVPARHVYVPVLINELLWVLLTRRNNFDFFLHTQPTLVGTNSTDEAKRVDSP